MISYESDTIISAMIDVKLDAGLEVMHFSVSVYQEDGIYFKIDASAAPSVTRDEVFLIAERFAGPSTCTVQTSGDQWDRWRLIYFTCESSGELHVDALKMLDERMG